MLPMMLPAQGQEAALPGAPVPQVLEGAPARLATPKSLATPKPLATPKSLAPALISELRALGPCGAEDSFVELCNTTDAPLDLSGWSLQFLKPAGRLVRVPLRPVPLVPRGHLLLVLQAPGAWRLR